MCELLNIKTIKNRKGYLAVLLLFSVWVNGQITFKITNLPESTPANATVYIAGNFNQWNPSATPLHRENGFYTYTLPEADGEIEYKFTLGSWERSETSMTGKIPNRKARYIGQPQTLNLAVAAWENSTQKKKSTASANVHILTEQFPIPQLQRSRRIWIYLPPDYEKNRKNYPVIYMQDGQNLFDEATSFSGEWEIDETLNRLFQEGDLGVIVVGIDNGAENRINEYIPWNHPKYGGGEGALYMQFIAETLKPYVDAHYRTKRNRAHNALMGSSLGALISTYGGVKYSKVFSKIGAFSPAYWIVAKQLGLYLAESPSQLSKTKIFLVAGSAESATMQKDIEQVKTLLEKKGLQKKNIVVKLDANGQHNENYWRGEFGLVYQWLFSRKKTGNQH